MDLWLLGHWVYKPEYIDKLLIVIIFCYVNEHSLNVENLLRVLSNNYSE